MENEVRVLVANRPRSSHDVRGGASPVLTLAATVLGFFMITLDAVVINVALPSIRGELGGGIIGCGPHAWTTRKTASATAATIKAVTTPGAVNPSAPAWIAP